MSMLTELVIRTHAQVELLDVTAQVQDVVRRGLIVDGLCSLFVPHTTAGLTLNEHADPDVREDILHLLDRLVPQTDAYRHAEGNSPAHIKATLLGFSALVPVEHGRLALGTWQGIYLAEFDGPRQRRLLVKVFAA
jgi:secondary thiamine-phosphate synthase enzyme